MNFQDCLLECCQSPELVSEFNRLSGTNISFKDNRKPIELMIDKATGYPYPFKNNKEDIQEFISFCFEYIWIPICEGCR